MSAERTGKSHVAVWVLAVPVLYLLGVPVVVEVYRQRGLHLPWMDLYEASFQWLYWNTPLLKPIEI